jgi:hypothetical protein
MVRRKAPEKIVMPGPAVEANSSPAAREAPWPYAIEMSVDKALTYLKPDYDFADLYDGRIVRRQIGREPVQAGRFLAIRIRIEDAHDLGASARAIFDALGERLTPLGLFCN